MSKYNGGPAFPCEPQRVNEYGEESDWYPGMALRDWFAGQALAGLMSIGPRDNEYLGSPKGSRLDEWVARACYEYADAMLKERES